MVLIMLKSMILKPGALTERTALPPSRVAAPVQKKLPGYKTYGVYDIQAYDRQLPALYGPYYVKQVSFFKLRVLTKVTWKPVNGAKFRFDLYPPKEIKKHFPLGQFGSSQCQAQFEGKGIYLIGCRFDEPGEWGVQLRFENITRTQEKIATLMFKALVKNTP